MRVNELMRSLNELEKKHGNLEVVMWDSYYEDCGILLLELKEVSEQNDYPYVRLNYF